MDGFAAGTAPPFGRRASVLIVGLVLARGVVVLCVLPPFEGWDEYQHVAYVDRMARGEGRPVLGAAEVTAEVVRATVAFPQSRAAIGDGLGHQGGVDHATFWSRHDPLAGMAGPRMNRNTSASAGTIRLYQAQHGPFYYGLVGPIYAALGGVAQAPRATLAALRFLNLVLTAAAVGLFLAILRRLTRSDVTAALLALPIAGHPLFLLNGTRVANDALGLLFATATIGLGLALGRMRPDGSARRAVGLALGLGAGLGLAVRAKATNLALLPFVAACALMAPRGPGTRATRLVGPLILAAFLLVDGSDLAFNLAHHGSPTAMQESARNREQGHTLADLAESAGTVRWGTVLDRLWARELYFKGGWSFLRTWPAATSSYQLLVRLGLLGWGVWLIRGVLQALRPNRRRAGAPSARAPDRLVPGTVLVLLSVVVLGYSGALAYHMVASKLAWGVSTTCPWYACPALPWFLVLVGLGGWGWLPARGRGLFSWGLLLVGLLGEVVGLAGMMVPSYAGLDVTWRVDLARLAWLQPAVLGTPTLLVAGIAEVTILAALVLTFRDAHRGATTGVAVTPGPRAYRGGHVPAPTARVRRS